MNTAKDKKEKIEADKQRELATIQREAAIAEQNRKKNDDLIMIAVCSSMMSCI